MKKSMLFSEKQILDWAEAYYNDVYEDDKENKDENNLQEAEIVDANIEVPQEEVEKAEMTAREKFDAVFDHFKDRYENDERQSKNEEKAYYSAYANGAMTMGGGAISAALGGAMMTTGALASSSPLVAGGLGFLLATSGFIVATSVIDSIKTKKQIKESKDSGLTFNEFKMLKDYDKRLLKFAKKNKRAPEPDDDIHMKSQDYYMYLQMKMLQHKYLMQDKVGSAQEVTKEEE